MDNNSMHFFTVNRAKPRPFKDHIVCIKPIKHSLSKVQTNYCIPKLKGPVSKNDDWILKRHESPSKCIHIGLPWDLGTTDDGNNRYMPTPYSEILKLKHKTLICFLGGPCFILFGSWVLGVFFPLVSAIHVVANMICMSLNLVCQFATVKDHSQTRWIAPTQNHSNDVLCVWIWLPTVKKCKVVCTTYIRK